MEVKKGSSLLLPSTVRAANTEDTFGSLLSKALASEGSDVQVKKVTISSNVSQHHIVPLDAPVMKVSGYLCILQGGHFLL